MNRLEFLEKRYTCIHIGFLVIMMIHLELNNWIGKSDDISLNKFLLAVGLAIMGVKFLVIKKGLLPKYHLYNCFKIIELLYVGILIYQDQTVLLPEVLFYLLILFEIFSTHSNLKALFFYFIPLIISSLIMLGKEFFLLTNFIDMLFLIVSNIFFIYIVNSTIHEIEKNSDKYKELLIQTQKKNEELLKIKEHMELVNKELEQQKEEMRKTSESFRNHVAELFILKETSSYIGSILEIQQLLEMVCDMIMGILGVDTCSIIVYDEKYETLDFHIKSIYSHEVIENFKTSISNSSLQKRMKDKEILINNNCREEKYSFLQGRDVGSFVAVPLYKGNKSYGLILAEHTLENYFSTSNTDLFKAVSMQVAVAIENAKLYEQMEEMAARDGLTKVYNRMYLQRIMPEMIENAKLNYEPISIGIFDIDHFKVLNDTYGHLFGDEVLKAIAHLAQKKVEAYHGIVARYGGEEFVMIFPNVPLKEAAFIVEELRQEIEQFTLTKDDITAKITASFGVSGFPEVDGQNLLRTADDAMYMSKRQGRNRVTVACVNENNVLNLNVMQ
ncbi:diguanylate cyclase [Defluviitalea raffinosedens]|jgi:diguanylate cyclase (GGDEF)-like protein|uniref:sensor domain-containing diguanylate cyclase n=1 Tax=Defluviitalea raffinosedens TaxID=1450156 RepID=UPI001752F2B9|nr:diguanylate cyclase [Defluviitalea raffinosedens]MBM7686430.1 diguanylate cyclase (GGDEF)-like protein [Defluviitalea raffinosedens]MBZ4669434.1 diguanylate cyclase protein [Defluviitaleaceae bacterium]HHW67216.1 diguanylate cyclase [Candidatus Epulonipiscium sp.]